jgi:hypothetical protein
MDALTSTLLSTAHHLSEQLGPVTSLLDRLLDRLAPQATAAACSGRLCSQTQVPCKFVGCIEIVSRYSSTGHCTHITCTTTSPCFC